MLDITSILQDWDYDPEGVTVRLIEGLDGTKKIQMRLDLGLLQMEMEGRPDGKRPQGYDSYLDYFNQQLRDYINQNESDQGFYLDPDECLALQNEATQYYYRYLSLFHLGDYAAVERDTARNLRAFDFLRKYAEREEDRLQLEPYRPYVLMMNARAAALRLIENGHRAQAEMRVDEAIHKIRVFLEQYAEPSAIERCGELHFLNEFLIEIRQPSHENEAEQIDELRRLMREAVDREDYETAAILRDQIRRIEDNGE